MQRFRDEYQSIHDFTDRFLVNCPECHHCATVQPLDPAQNQQQPAVWRFICGNCAAVKVLGDRPVRKQPSPTVDPYFHYPLWLQASCCSEQLWAFNPEHLDFLAAFVQAQHRESRPHTIHGWSNRSLVSRLPKWIQSHKNRAAILKTIAQLRQSLPESSAPDITRST
ncbi:hypothetical protein IQ266_05555 [filamentous cyanobacterium LEGE 11480]|uniref:Uncharacterized protein n=1 Tax=Romeriopsis navalis LEGE 11480 TaxID=2777977 RepID=A0A928VII2_9CYAN|nr:hypothetical protein [Romeriopsis navalis]MBE9029226.1 hypothetical protein [Romeriopsis navalis LEGE 11480]